ncbi:hypothetical protein ACFQ78_27230 [Streptomyces sp. NPDC056519]|uniref:hypothetical protein n=1 Tax=Streptomyces sp. NPDC056519 TaxID=3345849 RepID=UPI0036AB6819
MKLARQIGAATAVGIAGTLVIASAPAASALGSATEAERSAVVVEKATGTGDLATSVSAGAAAAEAIVMTATGEVTVSAPRTSAGEVRAVAADGSLLGLELKDAGNVAGLKAGHGTVVYTNVARSTDLAVQPTTDGGIRTLVTLKDASAPTEQRFDLRLPPNTRAVPDGTGGFDIVKDGTPLSMGAIAAPWAKDAHGKPVSTSYALEGGTLVQRIETNSDTAFPVVVDPKFTWGIVTGTAYLNKSETNSVTTYGGLATFAASYLPPPFNVVAGLDMVTIIANANSAKNSGECVKLKLMVPLVVSGIYSGGYCT